MVVRVGVRLIVGVRVIVPVREGVSVVEEVGEIVGVGESVGMRVRVGVGVEVENAAWLVALAWSTLTGVISAELQYFPYIVQAICNSSGESGTGAEGGLMACMPLSPPNVTLTFCPAPKYCS